MPRYTQSLILFQSSDEYFCELFSQVLRSSCEWCSLELIDIPILIIFNYSSSRSASSSESSDDSRSSQYRKRSSNSRVGPKPRAGGRVSPPGRHNKGSAAIKDGRRSISPHPPSRRRLSPPAGKRKNEIVKGKGGIDG